MTTRSSWQLWLLAVSVVIGILLGWLCARVVLVGNAWSLVPWAIIAIAIGFVAQTWPRALTFGAVYGSLLALSFLISGYQGTAPLTEVLIPFLGLGMIGLAFGVAFAAVGHVIGAARERRGGGI